MDRDTRDLDFCKRQLCLCFGGSGVRMSPPGTGCEAESPCSHTESLCSFYTVLFRKGVISSGGPLGPKKNLAKISCNRQVVKIT